MSNETKNRVAGKAIVEEASATTTNEKTTAVVESNPHQVAATGMTSVQGMTISFPYAKVYYTVAKWEPEEGRNNAQQGAIYLQSSKEKKPIRIANTGADAGINAILLSAMVGWKEDRAFDPLNPVPTAPRRFASRAEAEKAGLRTTWLNDPTRVKPNGLPVGVPPEASEFCYLRVLAPIAEDKLDKFSTGDFCVFKIGETAYTPMCIEFTKQSCRNMMKTLQNLEQMDRIRHMKDKDYKFQLAGMVVHIYTDQLAGKTVPFLYLERAIRDGKPWAFTEEEKSDFLTFLMSTQPGEVPQEEAEQAASTDKDW